MDATNFHIVVKLSINDVNNRQSQENEDFFARGDFQMFWIIVIIRDFLMSFPKFPGLIPDMLNFGIKFPKSE